MSNLSTRPQNLSFGDRVNKNNKKRMRIQFNKNKLKYLDNPTYCKQCGTIIPYRTYNKFCNSSCSATYTNSRRTRKPMSQKGRNNISTSKTKYKPKIYKSKKRIYSKIYYYMCKVCNSNFYSKIKLTHNYKCSECISVDYCNIYTKTCKSCNIKFVSKNHKKYCSSCIPTLTYYRVQATFKFNVYEYPTEFDLSLVESIGWYSPNGYKRKNKTPNLSGASRDHLYSVVDGFKNKVDPKLLAHPANCKIIKHNGPNGNNTKHSNSSITLDKLKLRILEWDQKYF